MHRRILKVPSRDILERLDPLAVIEIDFLARNGRFQPVVAHGHAVEGLGEGRVDIHAVRDEVQNGLDVGDML